MDGSDSHVEDEIPNVSVARGGPIVVPELVSPLTRVQDFQNSVIQHLQDLRAEACSGSSWACEEDLSVDELKIFPEEELVDKALKEAFKDGMGAENSSSLLEDELCDQGQTAIDTQPESSDKGSKAPTTSELSNGSCSGTAHNVQLRPRVSKKRKRRGSEPDQNQLAIENSYMGEVEQLVKIKQKQDEDKSAARLHSFNGSFQINESAITVPEKDAKMKLLKSISSKKKVTTSTSEHIAVSYPETVLSVEIYHNKRKSSKTQEFLVLGRQLLTELKDNIYCLTDEVMRKAGQYNPSGYFLIEDVFCNDLRDPAAVDYSKPILDWLRYSGDEALKKWKCIASGNLQEKQKKMLGDARAEKVPSFKSFEMQTTRFCDLRFQLGAGYLYCHQGDCRHRIVIRDMRLIHPEEVSTRTLYPLVTYQLKLHPRKCYVCNICRATKVTVDDKLAKDNPSYFCDKCYFLLHYSDDHSLLFDDFSVFDYVHD